MNNIGKRILSIICIAALLFSFLFALPPVSALEDGVSVWTGFASCESSAEGGRQAGGDGGHAYGIFQFDDRYTLWDFVGICLSEDAEKYSGFSELYNKYAGSGEVISENAADTTAMIQAWHNIYDSDPEGFTKIQLCTFADMFYMPLISYCTSKGIDINNEETYSPVIRGTLMSISIWAGQSGAKKVIDRLSADMTEEEMLNVCYSDFTAELKGTDSKYIESFRNRWTNVQKSLAAQAFIKWQGGMEIPTINSDNVLSMLGGAGILHGIDGGSYVDYVREWINSYPELSQEFKDTGGWNTENREWCQMLRNAGDFYELYGITGNGELLDFTGGTSGGISIGDINAELYEIPDNGGSMPIPYYTQGGAPWSALPFGGGNIGSSGCSITSLAMVVSYLTAGTDRDNWVFPSDIRDEIIKHTGNYNTFYVGNGQSWSIMSAVAGYYGLTCSEISSASIVSALAQGKPVIMSCKPGEFTSTGHFIVLTGLTEDGYITVNDPNSSHADKSYKKYTASYLASQGKGWWAFSN